MILHLAKVFFSLIRAWRVRENTKSNPCKETIEGFVDCQHLGVEQVNFRVSSERSAMFY
jgi:hypothetical protein